MNCEICGLKGNIQVPGHIKGEPAAKRVMCVGEAPGYTETKTGIPFTGESGQLLRSVLNAAGMPDDQVYFTNVCLCRPPANRDPSAVEMRCCNDRLLAEIDEFKPDAILLLGRIALNSFFPELKITESRGRKLMDKFYPIFHPAKILRVPSDFQTFVDDIDKAVNGPRATHNKEHEYKVVTSENLQSALNAIEGADKVALDIETTGIKLFQNKILCVGVAISDDFVYIFPHSLMERDAKKLEQSLKKTTIIGHSAVQFDAVFLKYHYGIDVFISYDTLLMHYAMDERKETHGLKRLVGDIFGHEDYSKAVSEYIEGDKCFLAECPEDLLYQYLAHDCCYTYAAYEYLAKEMVPDDMHTYFSLHLPHSRAIAAFSPIGVKIDKEYLEKTYTEWKEIADILAADIGNTAGIRGFNPNSSQQVANLLYDKLGYHGLKGRSTDKECLNYILELEGAPLWEWLLKADKVPEYESLMEVPADKLLPNYLHSAYDKYWIVKSILDFRQTTKILSTYFVGILGRLDIDDRIRTDFLVHGTETGRLSSRNPNLQNIPHHMQHPFMPSKLVRDMFVASDGYELVTMDYKALELRCAAYLSDDKQLLSDLQTEDLHTATASKMFDVPPEQVTKLQRHGAKSINFGALYDRGAKAIAKQIGCSQVVAQSWMDMWFELYHDVAEWKEGVKLDVLGDKSKGIKGKHEIATVFGNKRRFPLICDQNKRDVGTQSVNLCVQGLAGNICNKAMVRLMDKIPDLHILIQVHDELLFEIRDRSQIPRIKEIMEEDVLPNQTIKFEVDIKIGARWGSLDDYNIRRN